MKKIRKFLKESVCCLCCAMVLGGIPRFIPVARQCPEEEICIVNNASPVGEDDNTSGYDEPHENQKPRKERRKMD